MSAYFLVTVDFDGAGPERMQAYDQYIEKVKPIVEAHGGEYLVRTNEIIPLSKDFQPNRVILIRFEDRKKLTDCFASPEYAAVMGLRENSVHAHALIVEGK